MDCRVYYVCWYVCWCGTLITSARCLFNSLIYAELRHYLWSNSDWGYPSAYEETLKDAGKLDWLKITSNNKRRDSWQYSLGWIVQHVLYSYRWVMYLPCYVSLLSKKWNLYRKFLSCTLTHCDWNKMAQHFKFWMNLCVFSLLISRKFVKCYNKSALVGIISDNKQLHKPIKA